MAREGREPEIPDFREIMNMDMAMNLTEREWKNNVPNDLAARMTREKLYNLFSDVPQDVLSEMLMAHDNNFQTTVEVLFIYY